MGLNDEERKAMVGLEMEKADRFWSHGARHGVRS